MAKKKRRLKIFIGSSGQVRPSLHSIAALLQRAGAEPLPWTKVGLFRPGTLLLPKLIDLAKELDAAVFIFAEDDRVRVKGKHLMQTRDNVLIEYGLFASVMGHDKAIACRYGNPKIPSDLGGVTYVDISPRKKRAAHLQITEWVRDLIARADSGKVSNNLTDEINLSEGYASLTQRRLQHEANRNAKKNRHSAPSFDTVDNAVAKSIMEKLLDKSTYPNLVEHVTSLEIDEIGNCRCRVRQRIRASHDGLYFTSHFMEGDVAQSTFDDLELEIRTFDPDQFAWWMPINDTPKAKSILVVYDPPIQKKEHVVIEISWRWRGIFRRIANNQADIWDENLLASTALDLFRVNFRLHPSLPKVTIRPSGQTGGKRVAVRELAADKNGNRRYVCEANGISGRSKLALHLKPHNNP